MSIDEVKNIESSESESPEDSFIDLELKNEAGVFRMKEAGDGKITVEVENTEGKKFILNDLLPEDWRILARASLGGAIQEREQSIC